MSRKAALVLMVAAVSVVSGCTAANETAAPPAINQVGLYLHTCLQLDGEASDTCTQAALAECPPEYVSRDACLMASLDQLAAFEAYEPEAPRDDLAPAALFGVALLVPAGFSILGWGVSRSTRRRNEAAFADAANRLSSRGFAQLPVVEFPSLPEAGRLKPLHGLVSRSEPSMWALEFEPPLGGVNKAWPTRVAMIETDAAAADGTLVALSHRGTDGSADFANSFPDADLLGSAPGPVESLLRPHHPYVSLMRRGGLISIVMGTPLKVLGKKPTPAMSLVELVDLAQSVATTIETANSNG